jgi:beta-lactamase regulating signal transducer with metallopeptidase domain
VTTAVAVIVDITVITALALLICRVLRHQPAALRHMVLAAALAAAAAVPLLEAALPHWEIAVLPGTSQAASSGLTLNDDSPAAGLVGVTHVADTPLFTWSEILLLIWAFGFVIVMTGLLAGLARLVVLTWRCRPIPSSAWREHASSLAAHFALRPVAVLEGDARTPLLTWGFFTPRIIVPAGAALWTAARIESVLAHELAHIARRDWALQIAAQIVCAVYWFNPLMWMACRRLRDESEQACDDAVLRRGVNPADYASHLLAVAREVLAGGNRWASAPAIVNSSSLERRIAAMLNSSRRRESLTFGAGMVTLLAVFAVATPMVAVTLTESDQSMMIVPGIARDVALSAQTSAPAASTQPLLQGRPVVRRAAPRPVVASPADAAAPAAQAPASLSGSLRDASGAMLPGVQVTVANTAGASYPAVTDASGRFLLRDIPPARYELTARLPGFRSITETVDLSRGGEQQISLVMQVGGLTETVTVNCGAGAAVLPRSSTAPLLAIDRRSVTPLARRSLGEGGSLFALPQAQLPVRVGGQIAAPRQISHIAPTCPAAAVPGGSYVVILETTIGADGSVRDIVSLRPRTADAETGPFVQAAMEAIRQWQYTPTRLNNVPIPVIMTVTVQFSSK